MPSVVLSGRRGGKGEWLRMLRAMHGNYHAITKRLRETRLSPQWAGERWDIRLGGVVHRPGFTVSTCEILTRKFEDATPEALRDAEKHFILAQSPFFEKKYYIIGVRDKLADALEERFDEV